MSTEIDTALPFDSAPKHESREDAQRPVERLVIPPEVLDLVRFMCATWADIDKWAYKNIDGDALMKYPVIQGMRNQINLQRIGEQPYDTANIHKAVKWLME